MDRQRTNPFVEFLELLADLAILNVLFLLCCLPVVTAGASLAGLNYAAEKLRRQEGRPAANFFRGFRVNFRQATIFWIIFLCKHNTHSGLAVANLKSMGSFMLLKQGTYSTCFFDTGLG